jgi:Tol biopolymer transport system component
VQFAFVHLHARGWVGRVTTEIWIARIEPPMARQLTILDGLTIDPSWTPDGKRVLFASNRDGQFEIYSADIASREVNRLTHHPSADTDPVSSPDGTGVLFVSTRSGSLGLWLLREGESEAVPLMPFRDKGVRCKDPDWR